MKRRCVILLSVLGLLAAGSAYLVFYEPETVSDVLGVTRTPHDKEAFDEWLAQSREHEHEFAALSAYLDKQGVSGIVPAWQLTRSDAFLSKRCQGLAFAVPPRKLWSNVVPVLRFVRQEVVPLVGPVDVVSSYRAHETNRCANGAIGSKHLTFAGVDLVARKHPANRQLFDRLCKLQRRLGPRSRFGLGAYFNPNLPMRNRIGRFHVDVSGYRSWGFGYKGRSSGCKYLEQR